MKRFKRSFYVLALLVCSAGVSRADTAFTTYSTADTTGTSTVSQNSDGSYTLQTQAGMKSSLYMFNGGPLGTLGNLSNFSATFKTDSADAARPANELAFRFFLDNGASLVWENNSQNPVGTPSSSFQTVTFSDGNFWEHSGSSNFNGAGQEQTLATWDTGTVAYTTNGDGAAATNLAINGNNYITAVQISYGSGLGAYTGTVENVKLDFTTGQAYIGAESPAPAPLPRTAVMGMACLGVVGIGRFIKRKPVIA